MPDDAPSAGLARAGAAFAARRTELRLSQRELARTGVIGQANLIGFEKGRSWPREETRAKLEAAVGWPPGTLSKLNAGSPPPDSAAIDRNGSASETTTMISGAVQIAGDPVGMLGGVVRLATDQLLERIDGLPADSAPEFGAECTKVLADVRALEALTLRAVRSTSGSAEMIKMLREIRAAYAALMSRAAASSDPTVGQRLYQARMDASLSVDEAADLGGVTAAVINAAESEADLTAEDRQRIEHLVTQLQGSTGA